MVIKGLSYTKDHEWIRIEGSAATVGITDHAQSLLGEVTFVELPQVGASFKQGEALGVVESSKAASDVFAPVAGVVTEVNGELESKPELLNHHCYDQGWICKMKVPHAKAAQPLMDADQYEQYLKEL